MAYLEVFKRTVPTGKTPYTNSESFVADIAARKASGDIIGTITHTENGEGFSIFYNIVLWKDQTCFNGWQATFNPTTIAERQAYNTVNGISYEGTYHEDI